MSLMIDCSSSFIYRWKPKWNSSRNKNEMSFTQIIANARYLNECLQLQFSWVFNLLAKEWEKDEEKKSWENFMLYFNIAMSFSKNHTSHDERTTVEKARICEHKWRATTTAMHSKQRVEIEVKQTDETEMRALIASKRK